MKCLICKNEMKNITIEKIEYHYCPNCYFLQKNEIFFPTKIKAKERYDNHICDERYEKYMKGIFNLIQPFLVGECLDYGCGKKHTLANIINGSGGICDYYDLFYFNQLKADKKYHTIILIEVVEHLEDPAAEIKKIKEMLNERGRIIIITNLHDNSMKNWWYFRDITHLSFFHKKTFEQLALDLNFSLEIDESTNLISLSCI